MLSLKPCLTASFSLSRDGNIFKSRIKRCPFGFTKTKEGGGFQLIRLGSETIHTGKES